MTTVTWKDATRTFGNWEKISAAFSTGYGVSSLVVSPRFYIWFLFYPFILYAGIKLMQHWVNYHQALKLKFIALELLIYFSLYYGVLIYNMTSNGMELNFVLLFNAFGGCLRFAVPMVVFALMIVGAHTKTKAANHRAGIVVCRRSLYCFGYGCTVKRYLFPGRFGTALSPAFSVFTDVGGFTPVVDTPAFISTAVKHFPRVSFFAAIPAWWPTDNFCCYRYSIFLSL